MENFTPQRSANGMYEFKHKTGLTLLLVPKSGLKVTTANITYHVGSRNEGLGVRGATHYLEHGMFKGSKLYNKKLKNGMWKLEEFGAYMNATTYNDRTNYFAVIDSDKLNEVIEREADRMYEPLLDQCELKKEMTVVRNEFERGENNDFEVLQKRIMATAFMAHPYHHSTIGWRSEIENVSAEALRKFHDTFYKPTNATYTFVGNFDRDQVMKMVDKEFSKFDVKDTSIPKMYTTEPLQFGQRRVVMQRPTNCALMCIAFKAPNGLHHDAIVLEAISHMISKGPNSLARPVKEGSNPVHDIIAEWERMKDPYLFCIWGTTNRPTEEALKTTEKEIMKLTKALQTEEKSKLLKEAKISIRNKWKNDMLGTRKMAMAINEAIARGDAFDVHKQFEVLDSITTKDVMRVAKDIFNVRRSTVGYLTNGNIPKPVSVGNYPSLDVKPFSVEDMPSKISAAEFSASNKEFTKYDGEKTDIRMSIQCDHSLKSYVQNKLFSGMLCKGFKFGNQKCSEEKLYEYLAEHNIQRQFMSDASTIHLQASIPTDHVMKASSLIDKELLHPMLHNKSFNYLKGKWSAEAYGNKNNVNKEAAVQFSQMLFHEKDPNYMWNTDRVVSQIESTTLSDITKLHKKIKSFPRLVTAVGKNDTSLKNVGTWKREYNNHLQNTGLQKDHRMEGKSSTVLKYGMVVRPENYDALKLAVAVLGNGFTGRLMKIVRDEHGLTYGINAKLRQLKGCCVFEVTGTFSPKLLEEGMKQTEIVIKDWLKDTLKDEIEVQKSECIGAQMVQFDAPGALASAIQYHKITYGNTDRINSYKKLISSITNEQVNKAKDVIKFDKLSRLRVGTF